MKTFDQNTPDMFEQKAPAMGENIWTKSFILLMLAHLSVNISFYASMPVYAMFLEDNFHLSGTILGAAVACYTATAIIARLPAGFCLDRYGRKRVYLPACCFFGVIYFLYPLSDTAIMSTIARVLHGALWGVTMGAAFTTAVDLLPASRRGEGIGYFGFAMVLGMAAGPGLGSLIAEICGYRFLFAACGVLAFSGFVLLCLVIFPVVTGKTEPASLMDSLLEKSSLPASLATLIFCIPYGIVMGYTGLFARDIPGASAGFFFFLFASGTALARLFCGKTFDRSGPAHVMTLGYIFLFSGCFSLAIAGGALFFSLGGLCLGLGFGIAVPVVEAMINNLAPPARRGAANATMMTAFDLGICLGLLVISPIQARFGWGVTYIVLCGCVGISALVFHRITLPRYAANSR